jgi:hypothetical protein
VGKYRRPRIVTHAGGPTQALVVVAAVVALCGASLFGVLSYLQTQVDLRQERLRGKWLDLQGQIAALEAENDRLGEQVARLKRSRQIDQEALSQLRANYRAKQEEVARLDRQLAFYESLLAPAGDKPGIQVHRLLVEPAGQENRFGVELILTQRSDHYEVTDGLVDFALEGLRDGEPVTLTLADVGVPQDDGLRFEFKFFQRLNIDLVLPEGFAPREVLVRVLPEQGPKAAAVIERRFPWVVQAP